MGLQGVKTVIRPPSFENWDEEPKIFRKPLSQQLISD